MLLRLSIDDGSVGDLHVCELIAKYGLENNTILYWPVMPTLCNEEKKRLSLSQADMQTLAKTFTIGSHTITHRLLTRVPVDQAKHEIAYSRQVLQDRFSQPIDSFCWPRGYTTPELKRYAEQVGYKEARGVAVGNLEAFTDYYDLPTTAHLGYDRKEYKGQRWLEYTVEKLGEATTKPDSVVHLWMHSYELLAYPNGLEQFEYVLDYIRQRQLA